MLAHYLYAANSPSEDVSLRYRFILSCLSNHGLLEAEFALPLIASSIHRLLFENNDNSLDTFRLFNEQKNQVLTITQLIKLAKQLVAENSKGNDKQEGKEPKTTLAQDECSLLELIVSDQESHPSQYADFWVEFLLQCPAFCKALRAQHPKMERLFILEQSLVGQCKPVEVINTTQEIKQSQINAFTAIKRNTVYKGGLDIDVIRDAWVQQNKKPLPESNLTEPSMLSEELHDAPPRPLYYDLDREALLAHTTASSKCLAI